VPKGVWGIAAVLVLLPCAWQTRKQVAYWQNSEKLFYHAVSVTKDNWLAWFNLGWNYDNQGRPDDALASYRKAVQIQPNYVSALVNIGVILATRKQFPDAIPYFERAVKADPASVDSHDDLGHALMEVGRFEAAIPHLRLVARERPNDVVALNSLAEALVRTGQFAQAIPCLEASLRAKPDQAAVHYSLAQALAKLRRTDQAILHFREAIRCQPNDPEALNSLAWIRAASPNPALRNGAEAVQLAQRACELTRYQRPVMLDILAAAYAEAGRFDEAVATAQKARALALASGQKELAAKDQQMLESFQARQAYHELPELPLTPPPDH
jgi:Flp pilus assembly protein TadD